MKGSGASVVAGRAAGTIWIELERLRQLVQLHLAVEGFNTGYRSELEAR